MALNFPASPSTGSVHNASNGLQYHFDGVKWVSQGAYNTSTINTLNFTQQGTGAVSRSVQNKLEDVVSVKDFGAVGDGTTNDKSSIENALAASNHVIIPAGEYLLDTNLTVAAGKHVEFKVGGKIKIGTGITLTFNGRITADDYQQIFSGAVGGTTFVENNPICWTIGVTGSPQISYATPFWFGAVADNATDDKGPLNCAILFGDNTYIPTGNYKTSSALIIKRSNQHIWGDGKSSKITQLDTGSGTGQICSISGVGTDDPATDIVPDVFGVSIHDLAFDTNDQDNENGIAFGFGVYESKYCNIWMSNIGRKPITFQYNTERNIVENIFIADGSQEPNSNHFLISLEGSTVVSKTITQANITEANPGIFTSSSHGFRKGDRLVYTSNGTNIVHSGGTLADGTEVFVEPITTNTFKIALTYGGTALEITNDGNDSQTFKRLPNVRDNIVRNVFAQTSGYGGIMCFLTSQNILENIIIHDITANPNTVAGAGILIRLREDNDNNFIKNIKADIISNSVLSADANSSDNVLEDIVCDKITNTSGSTNGRVGTISGDRNTIRRLKATSLDTDGYGIELDSTSSFNRLENCEITVNSTTNTALGLRGTNNEIQGGIYSATAATTRVVNVDGASNKIIGVHFVVPNFSGNSTQGIRLAAANNIVIGNTITGDGDGRIRIENAATNCVVSQNILTGSSAEIAKFFAGAKESIVANNIGDTDEGNNFMRWGPFRVWFDDGSDDMFMKASAPSNDTDGTRIGDQS